MINRRQFVILSAGAAAGCAGPRLRAEEREGSTAIIDAGPVSNYPADGLYDQFREDGFFIIRESNRLYARSSICTHKGCIVRSRGAEGFHCRCHGSRFDPDGAPTRGPAREPLPRLGVALDERQHVLVHLGRPIG